MTVQDVEEIYNKNCKILLKTKNETEWKHIACSWVEKLNIINMSIHIKLFYKLNTTLVNIPKEFCIVLDINFRRINKGPGITKINLKSRMRRLILWDSKTYFRATVIKILWYGSKNSPVEQDKSPKTNKIMWNLDLGKKWHCKFLGKSMDVTGTPFSTVHENQF